MSKIKKALEKAKEARNLAEERVMQDGERVARRSVQDEKDRTLECSGINPTYCQTEIVRVDPKILKRNKIFSYFHENGISDQIKILRTQVLDRMKEIGGNRLLVTSASTLEGKTLIAINLAVSISQELDRTVLFVETDMRTSSLHRYFGLQRRKGLADYLMGEAEIPDILLNPGIEKLVLLPGGRSLPLSAELLGAPRMQSLVKEMRERYPERFIIFDGSSLLSYADPLIFSRFIDGILLVVEAERTSRQDLRRSLELLRDKTLIGTVLNKARG